MSDHGQPQESDDDAAMMQAQAAAESQWLDLDEDEIAAFLHLHPTYFMSAREASDWYAGVDAAIRAERERIHGNAGSAQADFRKIGNQTFVNTTAGWRTRDALTAQQEKDK